MLRNRLRQLYQEAQFRAGPVSIFVNPFHFARKGLYRHVRALAAEIRGRTLDVGCGQKPYESLFRSSVYIGLEIDTPENRMQKKADVYYDGKAFPFDSEEFDSVVINEVFEHVFDPDGFMSEVGRVLKPGGALLMTVPFVSGTAAEALGLCPVLFLWHFRDPSEARVPGGNPAKERQRYPCHIPVDDGIYL